MNLSAGTIAVLPPAVVTVIFTIPAACAGLVALIEVALFTVNEVAGIVPKVTFVAPVRLVPVIFTTVLPVVGPDVGEIPVMVGSGGRAV